MSLRIKLTLLNVALILQVHRRIAIYSPGCMSLLYLRYLYPELEQMKPNHTLNCLLCLPKSLSVSTVGGSLKSLQSEGLGTHF